MRSDLKLAAEGQQGAERWIRWSGFVSKEAHPIRFQFGAGGCRADQEVHTDFINAWQGFLDSVVRRKSFAASCAATVVSGSLLRIRLRTITTQLTATTCLDHVPAPCHRGHRLDRTATERDPADDQDRDDLVGKMHLGCLSAVLVVALKKFHSSYLRIRLRQNLIRYLDV